MPTRVDAYTELSIDQDGCIGDLRYELIQVDDEMDTSDQTAHSYLLLRRDDPTCPKTREEQVRE